MNKTQKLSNSLVASCALATLGFSSAQAENYTYTPEAVYNTELKATGGYFFDDEMPYGFVSAAWKVADNASFGLQLGFTNKSESYKDSSTDITADLDVFTTGLFYKHNFILTEKASIYTSLGAGGAFARLGGSGHVGSASGSVSDNDTTFYADATIGVEYQLADQWSVNFGGRLFHVHQLEFFGVELTTDSVMAGLEAGLVYSF